MRMWMVHPSILCRKHLCGEHVEIHMFLGTILRGKSLNGYVDNNLLEFKQLKSRHDCLAAEMFKRGMNHKSPLIFNELPDVYSSKIIDSTVDVSKSLEDLLSRCEKCQIRYNKYLMKG